MKTNGYYITAVIQVTDPEKIQDAQKILSWLSEQSRAEPGCTKYTVFQDQTDPARFIIWECYEDLAAFEKHMQAEHTQHCIGLGFMEITALFQAEWVSG